MKIESNKKFEFADNYGHFYWYYSDISEHGTLIIHRVTDNDDEIFFSCEGYEAIALLNCLKNWKKEKEEDRQQFMATYGRHGSELGRPKE